MIAPETIAHLALHAPLAFLSVDSDGQIRWANHAAERLLGREMSELLRLPTLEIYAEGPEGKDRARALFQRFLAGETIVSQRVLLARPGGEVVPVLLDARGSVPPGSPTMLSLSVLRKLPPETNVAAEAPVGPPDGPDTLTLRLSAERAAERERLEHIVAENVRRLLLPLVSRARSTADARTRFVIDAIHDALQFLTHPFGAELAMRAPSLTPREIEVCALVRSGLGSKEIGAILGISHRSVEVHRSNVRRKLGITEPGVRLATYLADPGFGSRD